MEKSQQVPEAKKSSRKERLIALCIFGLLALNYPLLALFDNKSTWFDIPVLFLYLLGIWAGIIITTAWTLESGKKRTKEKNKEMRE